MAIDGDELNERLEKNGELMIAVSDFDKPIELHLHDTEVNEETVHLELTDGDLTFDVEEIVAAWHHTHSLKDLGLE
ncbi:hypothetical protein EGH25_05090 [Haladaptatus sp. F3-133]|jgi:hypothetical protein|uniref:Uncharacterized protein n=1 Tax=Halorutilus salinus TaxID=2487751 RepID=A0A9Q4C430_9EURY|nr:hypothetical protein [Halorutilus salinus]MCX2818726.1 hypothetical protein [Halorutilus salinus]